MSRAAVLATYLATRRRRFADRAALESWQERRLHWALRHAQRAFTFYTAIGSTQLADFPVMDKRQWLSNFAELNDRHLSLEQCLVLARRAEAERSFETSVAGRSVGLSTGTSGRQAAFLTVQAERDRWAGHMLAKALPQGLLAGARVALVLRAGGPLYANVGSGRVSFRFVDLYAPLAQQVAELAAFEPTVLAAPPRLLELLATQQRAGRLAIRPRTLYSVADVLEPEVARSVEAAFGVSLGQIYQATEGFLGITCDHGRLHLNEDLLVFETEHLGQGRFTPVITDLYRTSQAVIRYRLGDVLAGVDSECGCGSPLRGVAAVEGRTDDLLQLVATDGTTRHCFPDLVRAAVLETAGVEDFQLVQESPDRLQLAVQPAERWPMAAAALRERLAVAGFSVPALEQFDFLAQPVSAKRRRIRRGF